MNQRGYEPLPDVEASTMYADSINIQGASAKEKELLSILEIAIEDKIDVYSPPLLKIEYFRCRDVGFFFFALKNTLLTFVIFFLGSMLVIAFNNHKLNSSFPYVTSLAAFCSTIPALRQRFDDSCTFTLSEKDVALVRIQQFISESSDEILNYVDKVKNGLAIVIRGRKSKLKQAKTQRRLLLEVDPTIQIPDSIDIENELKDANRRIVEEVEAFKESLDHEKYIPKVANSPEAFKKYFSYPIFALILFTQIFAAYVATEIDFQLGIKSGNLRINIDMGESTNATETLKATWTGQDALDFESKFMQSAFTDFFQFDLIRITVISFSLAILQIILVFVFTQKNVLQSKINKSMLIISSDIRENFRKEGSAIHDVLSVSILKIKRWLLDMIEKMERIKYCSSELQPRGPIFTDFGL